MRSFFLAALLITTPAIAADIDFTQPLRDLAGKPIPISAEKNAPSLTLSDVVITSLFNDAGRAQPNPAEAAADKKRRYVLAMKIHDHPKSALTVEEISLVKSAVNDVYPNPLVYGRVLELLDPAALQGQ